MIAIIEGLEATETRTAQCEMHGEFESQCYFGRVWTGCPVCTAEKAEAQRREAETREREARRAAWEQKIGGSGIPDRFRDRTLASYVAETLGQKRALSFAVEYADDFAQAVRTGKSAVFLGRPGTGKTHLSIGIALRILEQGRTVLFTSVFRAIRRIKETWRKGSEESESAAIACFTQPDLLILDEVGQQFGSETEKLMLFDVLNERYEKRRPTLLLANVPLDDYESAGRVNPGLKSFLGDRVMDRLREDGGEFIVFDWDSDRGRKRPA